MIKEDFPMTLKNLCEEFPDKDQNKKQKTIKKKSQRQKKIKKNIQQEKQIKTLQSLIKSQSYPSLSIIEQQIPLSSSLETLFSSVSTRDCVCHEQQLTSCEECLTLSCIRCSSTRTDLGYSSGLTFFLGKRGKQWTSAFWVSGDPDLGIHTVLLEANKNEKKTYIISLHRS